MKPFFLHIGFVGPHDPFDKPQRFLDMYEDRRLMEGFSREPYLDNHPMYGANRIDFFNMNEADFKEMRRHYYAKITLIDELLSLIMNTLKAHGLLENTVVVFTSDHGDNMGDHRLMYKWLMTEQTTRIPMMIHLPGVARGGTIDDRLFSQIDAGPALLDFAGGIIPAYLDGWNGAKSSPRLH